MGQQAEIEIGWRKMTTHKYRVGWLMVYNEVVRMIDEEAQEMETEQNRGE